jgi:two-component system, OmpR family, sensor histidine kinase MtrB
MAGGTEHRARVALSLRATFSFIVVALGLLTLSATIFLLVVGIHLRGSMGVVAHAVQSVHVTEGLEVDLLLHGRTREARSRAEIEDKIDQKLSELENFVDTDSERAALDDVARSVGAYLRVREAPDAFEQELDVVVAALERLVAVNVAQASEEDAKHKQWTSVAGSFGIAVAVVLLIGIMSSLIWLRRSAFRQVFEIAAAMEHYGEGVRSTRAKEHGPLELRSMAQQFNRMADDLDRQRDAEIVSLAGVAHDLRNPLAALKMALATLSSTDEISRDRHARTLGIVRRQVDKLDRMVGDLIDAARIESGRLELRIEEHDMRPILADVCELYRSISPNHQIAVDAPPNPVRIACDRLRIEQVIGNLVSNAVKYSPSGGRIELGLTLSDGAAVISVVDSGLGIDRERQANLFEPFRRVSSEAIPGVGLGLFVAKRIVEAHHGRIEVESVSGQGSIFRVRLPTSEGSTTAPATLG